MENILIKREKHNPTELNWGLCKNKRKLTFSFTESCLYKFNDEDDNDINKLFGIGLFMIPKSLTTSQHKKWFELHKHTSVRLGWNCNYESKTINLFNYSYINKTRVNSKICEIEINKIYSAEIFSSVNFNYICIKHNNKLIGDDIKHFGYNINNCIYFKLGAYFGGQKVAPNDVLIKTY